MNSTSATVKSLIEKASASTGQPDAIWEANAVSRLYFYDPNDPETSGAVDVIEGAAVERVKVELWCPPSMVAEIIARVTTGAALARPTIYAEPSLSVGPGTPGAVPALALKRKAPANTNAAPAHLPAENAEPPEHPRKIEPTPPDRWDIADAKRNEELKILVAQQLADEREEELREAREEAGEEMDEPREVGL